MQDEMLLQYQTILLTGFLNQNSNLVRNILMILCSIRPKALQTLMQGCHANQGYTNGDPSVHQPVSWLKIVFLRCTVLHSCFKLRPIRYSPPDEPINGPYWQKYFALKRKLQNPLYCGDKRNTSYFRLVSSEGRLFWKLFNGI